MKLLLTLLLFFNVSTHSNSASQDQVLGYWLSSKQDIKIQIYKLRGDYYGKIAWIKDGSTYSNHRLDVKNPDPMLRQRKIIGLTILKDFHFNTKSSNWEMGKIYHPKYGKTFKGKMVLKNSKTLKLTGYWGLLHDTGTWTRVNN